MAVAPRQGKPREARRFDRTFLSQRQHGRLVHRDYAAHFFRWGWARRFLGKGTRVVDVGCGPETPLYFVACGNNMNRPQCITCVDLSPLKESRAKDREMIGEFDFVNNWRDLLDGRDPWDVATCFEVIEHMDVDDGARLLEGLHGVLRPGGVLILSTPVFNGRAARNHVHEYEIEELQEAIEGAGFEVERRHGTFANLPAIRKELRLLEQGNPGLYEGTIELLEALGEYYADDVLSCFLAPLFPDISRNNVWLCRKPGDDPVVEDPSAVSDEPRGESEETR